MVLQLAVHVGGSSDKSRSSCRLCAILSRAQGYVQRPAEVLHSNEFFHFDGRRPGEEVGRVLYQPERRHHVDHTPAFTPRRWQKRQANGP